MGQVKCYDFGWHTEYHTKRQKNGIDCIYFDDERCCTDIKSRLGLYSCYE